MSHRISAPDGTDIFLSPRDLEDLQVDKEALALEVLDEYTTILQKHGRRSKETRDFLRRHRELLHDAESDLKSLVGLADFFYEARDLGVL